MQVLAHLGASQDRVDVLSQQLLVLGLLGALVLLRKTYNSISTTPSSVQGCSAEPAESRSLIGTGQGMRIAILKARQQDVKSAVSH